MSVDYALSQKIVDMAKQCCFDNCGIISVKDIEGYYAKLEKRKNNVPKSGGFYSAIESGFRITDHFPWAKSLIVCTIWYGKYKYPSTLQGRWAKAYALAEDKESGCENYHKRKEFENWMKENGIQFEGGEKYAPGGLFSMRYAAVEAGLGIFRKNNFFYTDKGSWYALEGYVIDKECEYKQKTEVRPCSDKCNLCQKNCPTGTLSEAYTMNPFHCISFITTFGQGIVPEGLTDKDIKQWVCGCDACQDACPHNRRHDWNQGDEFPNMEKMEQQLLPQSILNASDEELIQDVCTRTDKHIPPDQIATIRRCAERSLKNAQ